MSFPKSVVLHFPEEVYKFVGVADISPQLLNALGPDKVSAVQFLRNGRVRVTTKTTAYRDELLRGSSFRYGDVEVPVSAADALFLAVYVRDLPYEVPDADVVSVFKAFGVVLSIRPCFFKNFPSVANGTRVLQMSFTDPLPSTLYVASSPVRVWHPGQPAFCSVCREPGHLPRDCQYSGLCLKCRSPGHKARNCPSNMSTSAPSSVVPSSPASTPEPTPEPSPPSTPASFMSTRAPSPVPSSTPVPPPVVSTSASTPVPPVPPPVVSTSASAPVPSVPVTSVPSTSVLSVSVFPVSSPTVQSPVTSTSNFQVPVFPVSADVPLKEGEIAMFSEPSEAGASSSKPARSSNVPRVTPANDYKKLVRLVLPKVKPGSISSNVKKLCLSLVKTHRLNVSDDECSRIAESICSKF